MTAKKQKQKVVIILLILAGLFFFFNDDIPKTQLYSSVDFPTNSLPVKNPDKIRTAAIPIENTQIIKKDTFPQFPIQSIKQPFLLALADPSGSGNWWCDSSGNRVCSGSEAYCDNWCNPQEEVEGQIQPTCPSSAPVVSSDGRHCCPTTFPNYCSSVDVCYSDAGLCPSGIFNTPSGCPSSYCSLVSYPNLAIGGMVVYDPIGVDSSYNCYNKFGPSPTGTYLTAPGTACCYTRATGGETGSASDGPRADILGLQCSDKSIAKIACTQNGGVATCNPKDQCSGSALQCVDNIRYKTCSTFSPGVVEGVNIGSYKKISNEIFACGINEICAEGKCEIDTDRDGFPDIFDQCPNTNPGDEINKFGCPLICAKNEVKLSTGVCKVLVQTCIDNNLNNICDADDPIIWADPDNNVPICADRNADRVCDNVESLFCKDSNSNKICDSDEIKWLSSHCEDANGNGICDGIENEKTVCGKDFNPVCDISTNITYPNQCFATAFNVQTTTQGNCKIDPIIIRRDCASGDIPTPAGYVCDFETGWLFKRETIYQNVTIDCRISDSLSGYTCTQVGDKWVWTRTELVDIDCYSRGCPSSNQLCQGGICVESQKRCPTDIDCKAKYGADSVCDTEIGLCTQIQYLTKEVKITQFLTKEVNKTQQILIPVEDTSKLKVSQTFNIFLISLVIILTILVLFRPRRRLG